MDTPVRAVELRTYALFVPFVFVLIALIATRAPLSSIVTAVLAFVGIPLLIIALRRHQ